MSLEKIYDKSVEEFDEQFIKSEDRPRFCSCYEGDLYDAFPEDIAKVKSFLKHHTLSLIDAEMGDIANLQAEHANTARHGDTPDDAYDRVLDYLREERRLIAKPEDV